VSDHGNGAGDALAPEDREAAARVRVVSLRSTPLSVDELRVAVADPTAGGHALFVGTVRDHDDGQHVVGLSYSAHPSASRAMWKVALRAAGCDGVVAVAAEHRLGDLEVGDLAVVVAVSAAHRAEAFAACRTLIDDLKHEVPIWKHQRFATGEAEWVGAP
jgi:molybdopterin synthase catalytic subunit